MSTDFDVVCQKCKKIRHLGQRMAATYSFGFGSKDTEGAAEAAKWIEAHLECGPPPNLMIVECGTEFDQSKEFEYVHDEKIE